MRPCAARARMSSRVGPAPLAQMTPGFGSADPPKLAALTFFWSISFGLALLVVGVLVRDLDRRGQPVPRVVGALLLGMAVVGAVLVPASGFWLVIPAAYGIARWG